MSNIWNTDDTLSEVKEKFNNACEQYEYKINDNYRKLKERIDILPKNLNDLGLFNINNTADIDKPLSKAQKEYIDKEIIKLRSYLATKLAYDLSFVSFEVDNDDNFIQKTPLDTVDPALYTFYLDESNEISVSPNAVRFYYNYDITFDDCPTEISIPIPINEENRYYRLMILQVSGDTSPNVLIKYDGSVTTKNLNEGIVYEFTVDGGSLMDWANIDIKVNADIGDKGVYKLIIQSYKDETADSILNNTKLEVI